MRQNARRARITQPPDACAPLARMELRDELRDSISRWLACRHFSEWRYVAQHTARAIELTQDVRWPAGASRLEILDENGLAVHWRIEPNEPSASQEGVVAEFRQILR
jgi:hypothetical protein